MFGYYLDLALRSLKRSPGLTALMVLSIGVGVALAMTTWMLVHSLARDPIPHKSARLFVPTIDMLGPEARAKTGDREPPSLLDYGTAQALLRDGRATYQSANYWIAPTVVPARRDQHPFNASGFAVTGQFFPMLDVPFRYGSGWSDADDAARAPVAVISGELNDKLFGGRNSVGQTFSIDGRDYRVVGVLGHWNTQFAYYDVPAYGGYMVQPVGLFLPFNTAVAARMEPQGSTGCFKEPAQPGFEAFKQSNCVWISYMAELDTPAAARQYHAYLENFARQRFDWPPNVRLRDLMGWLDYLQALPPGVLMLPLAGVGLLIVCLVDTIGLMLARFLRRSGEIGVRRALGAPRSAIYAQFLTEGAVIGVAGGVVGVFFTALGVLWLRTRMPESWTMMLPRIDAEMLTITIATAIAATLLAAAYPTWRAAHVQPAIQVKTN
ncbi:MAG TPA: ABC transporter permease [Rhodanobacteraceae bacterium]|jgi:putative ABC transport system permease protein|nr:ABC transporter permease [Rhodanobacteraceae bacterium]